MGSSEKVNLTSAEMASLWDAYISYTHTICIVKYFRSKGEDQDVLQILDYVYQSLEKSKEELKTAIKQEGIPVPAGFSDQDVDLDAPRLFSDSFSLMYLKNTASVMMTSCALMFTVSTRKDIRNFFQSCLNMGTESFNQITDIMLSKGIYTRPPFIEAPKKNDFVESKDYLSGINFLKDQRLLNAIEITHLSANIEANVVGSTLMKGFAQTADLKEVRDFMDEAAKMSENVITSLTEFLTGSKLPAPMGSGAQVYSTDKAPFSDKLMMYEVSVLVAAGISDYASAMAASLRKDLRTHYMKLLKETSKLGGKAENLMIKNQWLEQPPQQDKITY